MEIIWPIRIQLNWNLVLQIEALAPLELLRKKIIGHDFTVAYIFTIHVSPVLKKAGRLVIG
jgi:hypothetical protein